MINAHHNVAEYSGEAFGRKVRLRHPFDCTLGGPFADLFFIRLAPYPDPLGKHDQLYLRFNGLFSLL